MRPHHRIVELPQSVDSRGALSFAQVPDQIDFTPARIFMIYGMKAGAERGNHAHREQHQFLMMMRGGAAVEIDDGDVRIKIVLDTPSQALYVPPMLWLRLVFSKEAICSVLASGPYDESDYIRDYSEFLAMTKSEGQP
jgi:hypothetical protein